ncbi:MAG TPA: hypothetical protein VHS78_05830 [Candidatus Elarobacter sp.]|jgi:hypothetical protein|nr:hypothetical protein [Candidatus Elarobacter sp.]
MVAAERAPRRDRIAIAGSIAIHCCVLALAATTILRPTIPVAEPDERTLFTSLLRIEHREVHRTARPHAVAAAASPVTAAVRPVVIHAAVAHERASHPQFVKAEHRAAAVALVVPSEPPQRVERSVAQAPPVQATVAARTVAAVTASTAAPSAAPAAPQVAPPRDDGIGNFGETYPASIDPSLRGTVLAGINGVVVRIAVDENGRPTSVEFVRAPADPAQRDELRSRLLAARFIPAACNGLRCAGTVELRS